MKHKLEVVQMERLRAFYDHAVGPNGLVNFLKTHRGNKRENIPGVESCTVESLKNLFIKSCWKKVNTHSGHANYQSLLLKEIHVGFECHGDSNVWGDHLANNIDQVQKLVNTMFNDVFALKKDEWTKKQPDWNQALANYQRLQNGLDGDEEVVNNSNKNQKINKNQNVKKNKNNNGLNSNN